MRVGVLTGGGDCPGLNAVIRAIVRRGAKEFDYEFIGFRDGWRGPLEGDTVPLVVQAVRGILPLGGTILGSSRTNPLGEAAASGGQSGLERIKENLASLGKLEPLSEAASKVPLKMTSVGLPSIGMLMVKLNFSALA